MFKKPDLKTIFVIALLSFTGSAAACSDAQENASISFHNDGGETKLSANQMHNINPTNSRRQNMVQRESEKNNLDVDYDDPVPAAWVDLY